CPARRGHPSCCGFPLMSELVRGPGSRRQAIASHVRVAVLSLCTFAVVVFGAFAWWDVHNRRLPDDLVDAAETANRAPIDPALPAAANAPPIAKPRASSPSIDIGLAARGRVIAGAAG